MKNANDEIQSVKLNENIDIVIDSENISKYENENKYSKNSKTLVDNINIKKSLSQSIESLESINPRTSEDKN